MVVWEDGRMKKSDYRKFIIRGERRGEVRGDVRREPHGETATALFPVLPQNAEKIPPEEIPGERRDGGKLDVEEIEPPVRKNLPAIPPGQNDDFASMYEAVARRYRRLQDEQKPMPSLILIDGGIGQLHAAAQALDALQIINQPLASIAKKEEILYIYGREDEPCILDRHSPVLHLIQQIRDETHRFAVTFHRLRRGKRQTRSALSDIPGVGPLLSLIHI